MGRGLRSECEAAGILSESEREAVSHRRGRKGIYTAWRACVSGAAGIGGGGTRSFRVGRRRAFRAEKSIARSALTAITSFNAADSDTPWLNLNLAQQIIAKSESAPGSAGDASAHKLLRAGGGTPSCGRR